MFKFASIALVVISVFACKKDRTPPPAEPPVTKEVEYRVFANDYSGPIYQHANADLQIRIINYKTGEMRLVWVSVFNNRKITDFPQWDNAVVIKRTFPVLESYEKLNGSYSVRHNDNGHVRQRATSDEAGKNSGSD